GGRAAIEEVFAAARPLAQVLWARETENGNFDTPERRAALEARVNEVTSQIGDEAVRRYYRQDFATRVSQFFAPPARSRQYNSSPRHAGNYNTPRVVGGRDFRGQRGNPNQRGFGPSVPNPYALVSRQMAASPLYIGHRTAIPRREALILQAALNHPWLLHDHLEDLASLEFRHAGAEKLKNAVIDLFAHDGSPDPAALKAELIRQGFTEIMEKIARAITTDNVWGALQNAAPADVLVTWQQLVGLHRQWHSLLKELQEAEQALGSDASETNFLRLRDVKTRLSKMEGTEALIEGFGASSGRPVRSI
ncbi:MAG TPA: DNA primase, partial [Propylenella sp.]|nr:DNA primase [Propylenella sp.]